MSDRTINLKLSSELLQQAEDVAGSDERLHDFLVSAIENEVQRQQTPIRKVDFWQKLEKLKNQMQQEDIKIKPEEIWGDVRDKDAGREIAW